MEELSQEEVNNWKRDPVTKKVFARYIGTIGQLTQMIVEGVSDYDYARGFIQGLASALEIQGDEVDGNQQ